MKDEIKMLCIRCLEVMHRAGFKTSRVEGSTGASGRCPGCGRRRLVESYWVWKGEKE